MLRDVGNFHRKLGVTPLMMYSFFDSCWRLLALGLVAAALGCNRAETTTVKVQFGAEWNGSTFQVGNQTTDVQGRAVQLEGLEAYVSEFALHDVATGWVEIDTIARLDFSDPSTHALLTMCLDEDLQIDAIRIGLGVPSDRNFDVDPAKYPQPNHPLGYAGSVGMHWGWADGYIFSIYEGRLLTTPNVPFAYHIGLDTLFRSIELRWDEAWLLEKGTQNHDINIALDAYACVHGQNDVIDPEMDPVTHTLGNLPLAERWVALYQNAWRLRP